MSRLCLVLLGALLAFNVHARGNADKGKQKAAQVCAACHGPDGNKPSAPDQPILAGQLSTQDMEDLAAWFSSQPTSSLHDQR